MPVELRFVKRMRIDLAAIAGGEWPDEDLEHLDHCPACGDARRRLLFEDMRDLSYGVAPGIWTMWQCENCTAAYIDPRPNETSIFRAYQAYYTHEPPDEARLRSLITGNGIGTRLRAGYYNTRYGYKLPNGWPLARMCSAFMSEKATQWQHFIRDSSATDHYGCADVGRRRRSISGAREGDSRLIRR